MFKVKKLLALLLAACIVMTVGVVAASAAEDDSDEVGAGGITVHCYSEAGAPNIYYWNSLPQNITTRRFYTA